MTTRSKKNHRSSSTRSTESKDPYWYRDSVIYQLHVKTFCDGNDDGVGDFKGLISKLDYLQNLGITAIWLLPFYPSPLRDDGYDIAKYTEVHPSYGTLKDFRLFLREAQQRHLRVVTELVINHTSDQHEWFQKSRQAKPGSFWRDFYVWSDSPKKYEEARIIFKDFETSNWTWDPVAEAYYWHRFYSHQPDLNYDNPEVLKRIQSIMDFWLEMGVDGLRLDAIPYLIEREGTNCENLNETHEIIRKIRQHIDVKHPDRMLLAEANQWPEDAVTYFGQGDECHMAFHFPLMPRMFMALHMEDRYPIVDILEQTPDLPEGCQWASFLRNHDELTLEMVTDEERDYMYRVYAKDTQARINLGIRRRLSPLLGYNRRKIELINVLLFSLPGTPIIYYGDEIGMGDNIYLGDRNGVRTPMQWSADKNAGFSRANPQKLLLPIIIDPEFHYERINVDLQENNLSSLLWWMRRVVAMRKRFLAFSRGSIEFVPSENAKVLSFIRKYKKENILVVINLSRFTQVVELDLTEYAGFVPEEVYSQNRFPIIRQDPYIMTLGPYDHFWLLLERENDEALTIESDSPVLLRQRPDASFWKGSRHREFINKILPSYLKTCRWFSGKARKITRLSITDHIALDLKPERQHPAQLVLVEIQYSEGSEDLFALPLQYLEAAEGVSFLANYPQAFVARYEGKEESGVLIDATYDPLFHHALLRTMASNRKIAGPKGNLHGVATKILEKQYRQNTLPETSVHLHAEQSNTSVIYDNQFFLKLYRRLQEGISSESEITRHLTETTPFPYAPSFIGALEYRSHDKNAEAISVGLLQEFTPNEGDAWTVALSALSRFYDRILAQRSSPLTELDELFEGAFLENTRLLAQRTGEMHLALADSEDPAFAPEFYTSLYQRSVYQSLREILKRNFRILSKKQGELSESLQSTAKECLTLESKISHIYQGILSGKIEARRIRIHGDYHLGQVLFTGRDFKIIDFEGEPGRSLGERRLKRCPLRDVAGMLRSFHYAAYHSLWQSRAIRQQDRAFLSQFADKWYESTATVFLEGYFEIMETSSLLPPDPKDRDLLLKMFLLDKAIYEIGYELNNRPEWVAIPIRGIMHLTQKEKGTA